MTIFNRISFLFTFLLKSKTIFKAHSPFLYSLISECFNSKPEKGEFKEVNQLRKKMKSCDNRIFITNFGEGKNKERKIKDIAKTSLTSKKRSEIIYQIIKKHNCKNIIELGTNLGINTIYMALANKGSIVHSIEGCKNLFEIAKQNIKKANINNINLIYNTFEKSLPQLLESTKTFDFIYIDGNHSYDATIKYFKMILKYKHNESILLFDDIHWSVGMKKAWQEIIENKEVTLSVDYFHSGIVFFKKELSKENFRLRYKNFFKTR